MSSIGITAKVSMSGVAPQQMIDRLGPLERNKAMAFSVRTLVQKHLVDYNRSHPNKLEGKRTNFYRQLSQSTIWSADASQGEVAITDFRAAQTILGGEIKPGKGVSFKNGKPTVALTIPASADSYGEKASKFDGKSTLIIFKEPHGKLVGMIVDKTLQRLGAGKERRNGAILGGRLNEKGVFKFKRILFWLVSSVIQRGQPEAIPDDGQIVEGAIDGVRKLTQNIFRGSNQATAVIWQG